MKPLPKAVEAVFKDVLSTFNLDQQFIVTGVIRACAGDNSEIVIGDLHDGEVLSFTSNAFDQCELTIRSRCEASALRDIREYFNQVSNGLGHVDFIFNQHDAEHFNAQLLADCEIEDIDSIHLHYLNINTCGQYTAAISFQLN